MSVECNPSVSESSPPEATRAAHLCLVLGRILFSFGATTQRIQDSVARLAVHLRCRVELLVNLEALQITVHDRATYRTRIDATRGAPGLNLDGLVSISEWVRGLPGTPTEPDRIENELYSIRDAKHLRGITPLVLAAAFAGAAFCLVNGGDPVSWLCSGVASGLILLLRRQLTARGFNTHLVFFMIALAGCLFAVLLARQLGVASPAVALVAPVLFLVPGVPFINGGIDIVRNHLSMGMARLGFALAVLAALCLAVGATAPLLPHSTGAPFEPTDTLGIALTTVAGAVAAGALACLNNAKLPLLLLCALGGAVGRLVRALTTLGGLDVITATLIGAIASTLFLTLIAERFHWPSVVVSVTAVLPMVPGYFAITGMHALVSFASASPADPEQLVAGVHALSRATFLSVALVVGVIGPSILLQRGKERV